MKEKLHLIKKGDNVAVALTGLKVDECVHIEDLSVTVKDDIPAGHKIALAKIKKEEKVIKYGFPVGRADKEIEIGQHVHTHNVKTLLTEKAEYHYNPSPMAPQVQSAPVPEIDVYRRKDGRIGIRNEIWIIPTVGCVNKTAEILANWANKELCGKGSGVDGVYAWTHPYGCSQMGSDHQMTRTILADLAKHPNAAAVLVLSLGCEKITTDEFKNALGSYADDTERMAFLITQDHEDELIEGRKLLLTLSLNASKAKREKAKMSELIVGMKCGASDGFSGITANPLTGMVCDTLCRAGASVILTEVPEMFGAEQMLMDRCENREVYDKTVSLISGFKEYLSSHNQVIYENPSPGNNDGGITTLEEKSCGCVQKGGKTPVVDVFRHGDIIPASSKGGLMLLEGPGNDIVSVTAMTAAGAHLILFTTGRGTPLGAPVPTIKIASNSGLAKKKANWIDFDAGPLLEKNAGTLCSELLELIAEIASGRKKAKNEINGYREISIFKTGVIL